MKVKLDYVSAVQLFPSGMWEVCTIMHGQLIRYRYSDCTKREAIRKFKSTFGASNPHPQERTMSLSNYLKKRSKDICLDNECTDENHNCESYAYITQDGELMDICVSHYFQGSSRPYAAIPLPWDGTQKELDGQVADQCADFEC